MTKYLLLFVGLLLLGNNLIAQEIVFYHRNKDGTHTIIDLSNNSVHHGAGYTKNEILNDYKDKGIIVIENDPEMDYKSRNPKKTNYPIIKREQKDNNKNIRRYKLSKRTKTELKKLKKLVKDIAKRQAFIDILLCLYPFTKLIGGASIDTIVEIGTFDWIQLAKASHNVSSHFRSQLHKFCQYEALSQYKSSQDLKFWMNLSKIFR